MAQDYNDVGDPYAPLEARRKQLEARRLQLLQEAAAARAIQNPGEGQMVGPHFVPTHWSHYLEKPTAGILNAVQQALHERDQKTYELEEASAASTHMAQVPSPRTRDQARPSPEFRGPMPEEAVQPSREEKAQWAQQGTRIPSLRKTLEKVMEDQLIDDPVREQARKEKALDRAAYGQRPAAHKPDWKLFTDMDGKMFRINLDTGEADQLKADGQPLNAKPKDTTPYTTVKDAAGQIRVLDRRDGTLGEAVGPMKVPTAKEPGAPKPLSDKARGDLDASDADRSGLAQATAALKKASGSGTGYAAGLVQEMLPGGSTIVGWMRDKPTKDAIQGLTFVSDGIRHGRFGASLTKPEKESAAQYLPSPYDDKAELVRKAEGLQKLLDLAHTRLRERGANTGSAGASWAGGTPETRVIGGKTYVKRDGQWYQQ